MFVTTIHLEKMRCLFKRKIFRLLRPCNVEIFAVLSDTAFGMHEIPHDGPYNTGIRNMEYALNFSSCLFMRATAMSRISTAVLLTSISHYWQCIFRRRLAVAMSGHPRLGRRCGMAQLDVDMIKHLGTMTIRISWDIPTYPTYPDLSATYG